MGTPSLRVRLVFEDRSILSNTQRSDGIDNSWILLKLQQHRTISDFCTHLLHIFKLHRSCPNGIILSMEGFALPPFESTEILQDKEMICVKKKGGPTIQAADGGDEVEDDGLQPGNLLLENADKEIAEYESDSEDVDEEQLEDGELPEETVRMKRKAPMDLENLMNKKRCLGMFNDEAETSNKKKISDLNSKPNDDINKKVKNPLTVKRSEELQENVEATDQVAKKLQSRRARRKKEKRKCMQELAKIGKKKPQPYSKPEVTKPESKDANGLPKGLLHWKQASKKPVQNGDVGLVVTKPGHIRFESCDEDEPAKQTGVLSEPSKLVFKDAQVPVIDPNDFDKLPPCEPKEGDVISEKMNEDGPKDGSLEINYSALVDDCNVKQYEPEAVINVTSDDKTDASKDSSPGDEANPWDPLSKVNPEVNNSSMVFSVYDVGGPSTSAGPNANKPESPKGKKGQTGNSLLTPNKPDPKPSEEDAAGWTGGKTIIPSENNGETGSSWGRPWPTIVATRGSWVKQLNYENNWSAGSSRGNGKPWSRGAPRGRGRGRGRGRNGNLI